VKIVECADGNGTARQSADCDWLRNMGMAFWSDERIFDVGLCYKAGGAGIQRRAH